MQTQKNRVFFVALIILAFFLFSNWPTRAETHADEFGNVHGTAYSDTVGFIYMNCKNDWNGNSLIEGDENQCGGGSFGVNINEDYFVTGLAWSPNIGLICFGSSCSGTPPSGEAKAVFDAQGKMTGWVKMMSVSDSAGGWVSLQGTVGDRSYGVSTTFASGIASGQWAGYGWNQNPDSTGIGWLDFRAVNTTFRGARWGDVIGPQGIYEPLCCKEGAAPLDGQCPADKPAVYCDKAGNVALVGSHLHQFKIEIKNIKGPVGLEIKCRIDKLDGHYFYLVGTTTQVNQNLFTLPYTIKASDIGQSPTWNIATCEATGVASVSIGQLIFVHPNTWNELNAVDQDMYRALDCWYGQKERYFSNKVRCNFEGDYAFTRSMSRGVPIELNCNDGIDNDNNGFTDCQDRWCKGISYQCLPVCGSDVPEPCKTGL